jgi:O-methyltransferase
MTNPKLNHIATKAYSTLETIYNTYNLVQEVLKKGIEGDFAECGIGAGSQIMAMKTALEHNPEKIIYAFDSFQGIPMAGEHDDLQPGIGQIVHNKYSPLHERLISSGISSHSMENVKENFNECGVSLDNVKFIKGWFQDIVPPFSHQIDRLSFLRLDGDLYESAIICLEYLYPKLSKGGVCIVDDWALDGTKKAIKDYFKGDIPELLTVEGGMGVVWFYKP